MGFDICGIKPKSEKGRYFSSNIWCWHPLAHFVLENVKLPKKEKKYWHSNDGQKVSAKSAKKIADKLTRLISSGTAKDFEEKHANSTYPFVVENVKDFAEFCRDSGGFEIC